MVEGNPRDAANPEPRPGPGVESEPASAQPAQPRYDLYELISCITLENRHDELDWGRPRGKEIW